MAGTMLVNFSDASAAQSAICQLTYQFGSADQQVTQVATPAIPGSGPAGVPVSVPVALNGLIPTGQGKKSVGWRVTAGTGPSLTVSTLTAWMMEIGTPAAQ